MAALKIVKIDYQAQFEHRGCIPKLLCVSIFSVGNAIGLRLTMFFDISLCTINKYFKAKTFQPVYFPNNTGYRAAWSGRTNVYYYVFIKVVKK